MALGYRLIVIGLWFMGVVIVTVIVTVMVAVIVTSIVTGKVRE